MKKFISAFLLIALTTNIGFAQMNISQNNETNDITKEEIKNLIDTYQEDINKIIKKEKSTLIYNSKHQRTYEIYATDKIQGSDNEAYTRHAEFIGRIEIPLCDGDYAVWNSKLFDKDGVAWRWKGKKAVQYIGEYHQNKNLMGIVKVKRINKKTIAFYEYRVNEKREITLDLKHIMICFYSKNPVIFITTTDGTIKGIRYKDTTLSTNFSNIADIENVDFSSVNNPNIANDVFNIAAHGVVGVGGAVGAIALMPLGLVIWPALMIFFMTTDNN